MAMGPAAQELSRNDGELRGKKDGELKGQGGELREKDEELRGGTPPTPHPE